MQNMLSVKGLVLALLVTLLVGCASASPSELLGHHDHAAIEPSSAVV